MLRRSAGFDVPDFLAAGPRDVSCARATWSSPARLLGTPEPLPVVESGASPPAGHAHAARLLLAVAGGGLAAAALAWALLGLGSL